MARTYTNVNTIMDKAKKGDLKTSSSFKFSGLEYAKRREIISPYLHWVDEVGLRKSLRKFFTENNHIYTKLEELKRRGTFKYDSAVIATEIRDAYNQEIVPNSLKSDIFNFHYHEMQEQDFAERRPYNHMGYKILEKVNNPMIKMLTNNYPMKAMIMTRSVVFQLLYAYVIKKQTDPEEAEKMMQQFSIMKTMSTLQKYTKPEQGQTSQNPPPEEGEGSPVPMPGQGKSDPNLPPSKGESQGSGNQGNQGNQKDQSGQGSQSNQSNQSQSKSDQSSQDEQSDEKDEEDTQSDDESLIDDEHKKEMDENAKNGADDYDDDNGDNWNDDEDNDNDDNNDFDDDDDDDNDDWDKDEDYRAIQQEAPHGNSTSAGKGGERVEQNIDQLLDSVLNTTLGSEESVKFGNALMEDTKDYLRKLDDIFTKEEMQNIWEDISDGNKAKEEDALMKLDENKLNQVYEALQRVSLNMDSVKSIIKNLLNKSMNYFSTKEESTFEDLFNADSMQGLEEIELLHPKIRKYFINDITVREVKKVGKVDIYLDISGSMGSSSGVVDDKGQAISAFDFAKAMIIKMKELDILNDFYTFDTNIIKRGNTMIDILATGYGGGTTINNVAKKVEKIGNNAICITDACDNCNIYSDQLFFLGVNNASFGYFDRATLKKYSDNDQMVLFTGKETFRINNRGQPFQ